MSQLHFFDDFDRQRMTRADDPPTSHEAAQLVNVTQRQQEALDWLARFPDSTSEEIDELAGYNRRQLSKRFGELKHMRYIEVTGTRICRVRGTNCETYKVTE